MPSASGKPPSLPNSCREPAVFARKWSMSSRTGPSDRTRRVLLSYGTRPEVIKLAPVIRALEHRPDRFAVYLCCTAQHRELIADVQAEVAVAVLGDAAVRSTVHLTDREERGHSADGRLRHVVRWVGDLTRGNCIP